MGQVYVKAVYKEILFITLDEDCRLKVHSLTVYLLTEDTSHLYISLAVDKIFQIHLTYYKKTDCLQMTYILIQEVGIFGFSLIYLNIWNKYAYTLILTVYKSNYIILSFVTFFVFNLDFSCLWNSILNGLCHERSHLIYFFMSCCNKCLVLCLILFFILYLSSLYRIFNTYCLFLIINYKSL